MDIQQAVTTRKSVRDFLDTPVPEPVLRKVLDIALRAPSGGNLQPWHLHVVTGEALNRLKTLMQEKVSQGFNEVPEYQIYPPKLQSPYRDRRFEIGELMYSQLGIPREDKAARFKWFQRNFEFFGAPVGLFCTVDDNMGPPQWSDLGMILQTIMLLLRGEGLDSCAQESWSVYPKTIAKFLNLPEGRKVFAGMAIGYANPDSPVNQISAPRAAFDELVEFRRD
ncbi:MAG TPA: nitroreductase [Marinobacter sp.]|nr:nitroreductase [Marinobacter sp.]